MLFYSRFIYQFKSKAYFWLITLISEAVKNAWKGEVYSLLVSDIVEEPRGEKRLSEISVFLPKILKPFFKYEWQEVGTLAPMELFYVGNLYYQILPGKYLKIVCEV